jgi:hypothetical protein
VERAGAGGAFINTTGTGRVREGIFLSANQARPGDAILVSGTLGDHGIAILAEREGLQFERQVTSDSAALHTLVDALPEGTRKIRCMPDPTRGGLSGTLNEIAASSRVGMELEETAIAVREEVRGACEMLALDPLYVANEGKLVAIVAASAAQDASCALQGQPLGRGARNHRTSYRRAPENGGHANSVWHHANCRHARGRSAAAHQRGARLHEIGIASSMLERWTQKLASVPEKKSLRWACQSGNPPASVRMRPRLRLRH